MIAEFYRPLSLDRIGLHGLDLTVEATPAECSALAVRMNLPAVLALSCTFHLIREGRDVVLARGVLRGRITQTCVISLEEFDADVEEIFQVDLGEAAAEQLGLALDPYPRMPGVEMPAAEDEPEPHPFAALRRLN
jgi:hypothetical protein